MSEDWVLVPKENQEEEMLRLVSAVSEAQALLGPDSGVSLGSVSRAVRQHNCNVQAAVAMLLDEKTRGGNSNHLGHDNNAHHHPRPSAPPLFALGRDEERRKCAFCEVLNPITNVKCFVCDSAMGPVPVVAEAPVEAAPSHRKCGFCEVLNPVSNLKCSVCDSSMGPPPPRKPNPGGNNNNDGLEIEKQCYLLLLLRRFFFFFL